MAFDLALKLANVTLPVATIFCSTWALISGHTDGAVFLFFGGMIFTVFLRWIDQECYKELLRHRY